MIEIDQYHEAALDFVEMASDLARSGKLTEAKGFYDRALASGRAAADLITPLVDLEPSRSLILFSVANIAFEANELEYCKDLVLKALAGTPPPNVTEDLRGLLDDVEKQLKVLERRTESAASELSARISSYRASKGFVAINDRLQRALGKWRRFIVGLMKPRETAHGADRSSPYIALNKSHMINDFIRFCEKLIMRLGVDRVASTARDVRNHTNDPIGLRGQLRLIVRVLEMAKSSHSERGSASDIAKSEIRASLWRVNEKLRRDEEVLCRVCTDRGDYSLTEQILPLHVGCVGLAARSGNVIVASRKASDDTSFYKELIRDFGFTPSQAKRINRSRWSWCAIPIMSAQTTSGSEKCLGVIFLDATKEHYFEDEAVMSITLALFTELLTYLFERNVSLTRSAVMANEPSTSQDAVMKETISTPGSEIEVKPVVLPKGQRLGISVNLSRAEFTQALEPKPVFN